MPVSKAIIFIALIFPSSISFGQRQSIDSLNRILPSLHDSARVDCLNELSEKSLGLPGWFSVDPGKAQMDSAEVWNSEALEEAKRVNYLYGIGNTFSLKAAIAYEKYEDFIQEEKFCKEAIKFCNEAGKIQGLYKTYWRMGQAFYSLSDFNDALNYLDTSYALSEDAGDLSYMLGSVVVSANVYLESGDYSGAIEKFQILHRLRSRNNDPLWKLTEMDQLGSLYSIVEEYDSAINFYKQGYNNDMELAHAFALNHQFDSARKYFNHYVPPDTTRERDLRFYLADVGEYHLQLKNENKALPYLFRSLNYNKQKKDVNQVMRLQIDISKTYYALDSNHSSLKFAQEALTVARQTDAKQVIRDAYKILFSIYDLWNRPDSAYFYYKKYTVINDSVVNYKIKGKLAAYGYVQKIELLNKEREIQEVRLQKESLEKKGFIAGGIVFLFIAFLLWRNNRHKQKAYLLLQKQKQETDIQKTKAEKAFQELTTTQSQLIQSEKMASLGELTAGIAHEIQNPLNFVNNFSEVNAELIDEAELAIGKGKTDEAKELLTNLRNNQSKINQHGKRAEAIVKGMLQHSRKTKGQKEPTDINALANEYLRLSYQGLRAKDKTFNADIETHFDPTIGSINIIPQDIGRVLLNLYNNAFYAVTEKNKDTQLSKGGVPYEPCITVSTTLIHSPSGDRGFEIRVRDNGAGIAQKVRDKIFQPFFTTKPSGQGTGLGLSLSYDIIKAHGGEIKVDTMEGEYAEFVIQIA